MNIFDQAIEIEQEGEALCRQFALEAPDRGMRTIFTWLADQEKKHAEIFSRLNASHPVTIEEIPDLGNLKTIFEEWKERTPCIESKTAQAELYRKALVVEQKSIEVYEGYANTSATGSQKQVFLLIAKEERRHRWILENIIEFVTRPEVWAENAEFSHLDKDYYL
jgi:rubrerythrin